LGGGGARPVRRSGGGGPPRGHAADVPLLCRARAGHTAALPAAVAGDRGARGAWPSGAPEAARAVEMVDLPTCCAVWNGFVRHRFSGPVAAGAVALPAVSDLGDGGRG